MKNLSGLSLEEVTARQKSGQGSSVAEPITKRKFKIIKENVFTLFNFLNFVIAILLFLVGAYSNMLFIAIIILNIVIGIAQELKAKKLVDELSILNRPYIKYNGNGSVFIGNSICVSGIDFLYYRFTEEDKALLS